jgi:hypothetical protein
VIVTTVHDGKPEPVCLDCLHAVRFSYGHKWRCTALPMYGPRQRHFNSPTLDGPICAQREHLPAPFWCLRRQERLQ